MTTTEGPVIYQKVIRIQTIGKKLCHWAKSGVYCAYEMNAMHMKLRIENSQHVGEGNLVSQGIQPYNHN